MTERDRQSSSEQTGRGGSPQASEIDPVQSPSDFLSQWQNAPFSQVTIDEAFGRDETSEIGVMGEPIVRHVAKWMREHPDLIPSASTHLTRKVQHGSLCHCVYCVEFE